jgi:hypothetical protein
MLTGVDPNIAPLGPPTKQVFGWSSRQPVEGAPAAADD